MVVFVSAFLQSYSIRRSLDEFFSHFYILAKSGIEILLFLDAKLQSSPQEEIIKQFPNVKIVEYITLDTSWYPSNISEIKLPERRNIAKDTIQYLSIQIMKMKLMNNASKYTNSEYLAWIDFSIFHIVKNIDETYNKLKNISNSNNFIKSHIITPSPNSNTNYQDLFNNPIWYFAGGFFIGHKSLFENAYTKQLSLIKQYLPLITWEVNYWFMMKELFKTYYGDHNDTIFNIPISQFIE